MLLSGMTTRFPVLWWVTWRTPSRQIDIPPGLGAQLAEPYTRLEHQGYDGVCLAWKRRA